MKINDIFTSELIKYCRKSSSIKCINDHVMPQSVFCVVYGNLWQFELIDPMLEQAVLICLSNLSVAEFSRKEMPRL